MSRRSFLENPLSAPPALHTKLPADTTMKLAVALFLAIVAPTAAFVPSTSCRGAITASRTCSTTALVSAWSYE